MLSPWVEKLVCAGIFPRKNYNRTCLGQLQQKNFDSQNVSNGERLLFKNVRRNWVDAKRNHIHVAVLSPAWSGVIELDGAKSLHLQCHRQVTQECEAEPTSNRRPSIRIRTKTIKQLFFLQWPLLCIIQPTAESEAIIIMTIISSYWAPRYFKPLSETHRAAN